MENLGNLVGLWNGHFIMSTFKKHDQKHLAISEPQHPSNEVSAPHKKKLGYFSWFWGFEIVNYSVRKHPDSLFILFFHPKSDNGSLRGKSEYFPRKVGSKLAGLDAVSLILSPFSSFRLIWANSSRVGVRRPSSQNRKWKQRFSMQI